MLNGCDKTVAKRPSHAEPVRRLPTRRDSLLMPRKASGGRWPPRPWAICFWFRA